MSASIAPATEDTWVIGRLFNILSASTRAVLSASLGTTLSF